MWYSYKRLFSYTSAFIYFVMTGRGNGKSYGAKEIIINHWKETKRQAVYVRRYETELDLIKTNYWDDVKKNPKYEDLEFDIIGNIGFINDEPVVHFLSLSTSSKLKSSSYPLVDYIFFDEYIITETTYSRYIKNEMILLLDLIETIFRERDNGKVVVMSNAVSFVNPLFTYWKIEPRGDKRFQTFRNGLVVLEQYSNDDFIRKKKATKFGRLIEGTDYGNYAIGNEVLDDNTDFILPKITGQIIYICAYYTDGKMVNVWKHKDTDILYVCDKENKQHGHRYFLKNEDAKEGYTSIRKYRTYHRNKLVKEKFQKSEVFYMNQEYKKFFINEVSKYI